MKFDPRNLFKNMNYRLGGAAMSVMDVPPDWNYQQYLRIYGQVGWLFGSVSLISHSVADVDWGLFVNRGKGNLEEIDNHPMLDMWRYVNPFQTKYQFVELVQMYLGLVGEAFIVLNFNRLNRPAEMWLAPPQFMHIIPSPETYISHYEYRRDFGTLRLEVPEVIHIYSPNPFRQYRGIGPAQSISVDLDSERFASRYTQRLFYNDATPGMIIEYPEIPEEGERKRIRKEWNEIHQGWRNARKTGFLWGGAKANTVAMSNRDMDFWRLRKINRETIIGAYHIPTSLMGLEGPGSRARVEADEYIFAKYTVRPALTRIKEALNEQLLPLYDDRLVFKFADPVPENREKSVDEVHKLVPVGVITREEGRQKLGYDAQPQKGETFLMPMAVMPEASKMLVPMVKKFSEEQKEAHWRKYVARAEEQEIGFKAAFGKLWNKQAKEIADAFENTGNLDMAFNEETEAEKWDAGLEPIIKEVFIETFEEVIRGERSVRAHSKQEGQLSQLALEWITTRSLRLAKMVNGTTKEQLRRVLAAGFAEDEAPAQLARRIRSYYHDGYERRATMVARTEVIAATNEAALQGYEQEGLQKVEFYAALDERTCEECMSYHGQVATPSEVHNLIPVHPDCRCDWVPVVE